MNRSKIITSLKRAKAAIAKPFHHLFHTKKSNQFPGSNAKDPDVENSHNCCFPPLSIFRKKKKKKEAQIPYVGVEGAEPENPTEEITVGASVIDNGVSDSSEEKRLPGLKLTTRQKQILQGCDWLEDDIIDAAQAMLKRQFGADGLQSVIEAQWQVVPVCGPAVQIHFDSDRNHWLASCFRSDRVEIMDSLKSSKLSNSMKRQIPEYYGEVAPDPLGSLIQLKVHQQPNGNDCGVYAIANVCELLANGDPTGCRYDEKRMRQHLIECLERGEITPFPKEAQCFSRSVTKRQKRDKERNTKCSKVQAKAPTDTSVAPTHSNMTLQWLLIECECELILHLSCYVVYLHICTPIAIVQLSFSLLIPLLN
ncbi:hypothetical protein XELAEV_18032359mg [Xenopus laevis]|uniref:Ubiquitin-like protease family profile domain-containing protein n=1 Tax=Xenopus laevis TaxID=8355 RepID=A0A974HGN1_XENLA|nr:hypothetical protein XELAEV_18032359mg [Xenopus laevis]